MANMRIAIAPDEAGFADSTQNLLSHARASEENHGIGFIDVRIMDSVKDMMFSDFLAGSFKAGYIRFNSVDKIVIYHQGVLSLLVTLKKDTPAAMNPGSAKFDDQSL